MKIALISDTHFGDPTCTLIGRNKSTNRPVLGPRYAAFKDAAGQRNDFLVLLGDIFDFAVSSYDKAYEVGKAFFLQIQKDRIAKQLIYIPGNHDADIWHIVEHEVNIIQQMLKRRLPRRFRMSVPGLIDDRSKSKCKGFTLHGVTRHGRTQKYAGLFLDNITAPQASRSRFNFAFPNLYMVTDRESVLMTHGHFWDMFWSLGSVWGQRVFGKEALGIAGPLDLKSLVGMNFPLSQLGSSGVGQSKPLTDVLYRIQREVQANKLEETVKYIDNLADQLDKHTFNFCCLDPREWIADLITIVVKSKVLKMLAKVEEPRYNENYFSDPEVKQRFREYYDASCTEIADLMECYGCPIPFPTSVICGHTHLPCSWGSDQAQIAETSNGRRITLFNAGGWLQNDANGKNCLPIAEVFTYSTEKGFASISID